MVIDAEVGGPIKLKNTFADGRFRSEKKYTQQGEIILINTTPGEQIKLTATQG